MDIESMKSLVEKSPLFGREDARSVEFNDEKVCSEQGCPFPNQVVVYRGDIIDAIEFKYKEFEGKRSFKHGGYGGSSAVLRLEEGEYLTKVSGYYQIYAGEQVISRIIFDTNKGKHWDAGSWLRGGTYFEYQVPNGKAICCMYGYTGRFLNRIGFLVRSIQVNPGNIFPGNKAFGF